MVGPSLLISRTSNVSFPSLFIIHETRAFRPFASPSPSVSKDAPWQKWITSDGVFDQNCFNRDGVEQAHGRNVNTQPQLQPTAAPKGDAAGDRTLVELNDNVIAESSDVGLAIVEGLPNRGYELGRRKHTEIHLHYWHSGILNLCVVMV